MHYTNFTANISSAPYNPTYSIPSLLSKNSTSRYKDLISFQTVPVDITNTGSTSSDYVVLGFLSGSFGPTPYPQKSLVAYTRLHNITGGALQTGYLNLTLGSLARANNDGDVVLYPGDYSLTIDTDTKAMWNFTLTGDPMTLDSWPAPPPFRRNPGNGTM
jgi:beta-D-xylosidase 4